MSTIDSVLSDVDNTDALLVLDGGFGSLLESLGYSVSTHELWSGGANIDRPDLVLNAHKLFIEAGADVITTNTYHCSIQKMIDAKGYTFQQAEAVLKKAVEMARQAIHESKRNDSIALIGSIGPYATYLRDGSEYSGNYSKQSDFRTQMIVDYYKQQAKPLLETGVERIVFETIPTLVEVKCVGEVLAELLRKTPKLRAWIVVTCQDEERTRGGDAFADVVQLAGEMEGVECVGINCTAPIHVTSLLKAGAAVTKKQKKPPYFVVYPNSGEIYNTEAGKFEGDTQIEQIAAQVPEWRALGVRVVGGCCRVMPSHIRTIAVACRQPHKTQRTESPLA